MMCTASSSVACDTRDEDNQYKDFLNAVHARFQDAIADGARLFTTTAEGLFDAFLLGLSTDRRQHYTCRACQRFVDRFGGLVVIDADGVATSALWDQESTPPFFAASVRAMTRILSRAKVNGVFLCEETEWGTSASVGVKAPFAWRHLAVIPDAAHVHKPSAVLSTSQVMAEKLQDYGTLQRGLAEFPLAVVRQAVMLLTTDALHRSEACIGVAEWLLKLHMRSHSMSIRGCRENVVWRAVASAPAGFCHVRSTMIGTLLEDIAANKPFAEIKRSFDSKMAPLKYQRPVAPPTAGNIAQAETIVSTLASAGALARRFAKLEDIQTLWKPRPAKPVAPAGGVFGHLKPASTPALAPIEQPAVTMTWEKFAKTVLPTADSIEFLVVSSSPNYSAMVTAADLAAPPILQWDSPESRNPVSWYLYPNGSTAHAWNLTAGLFHKVTAVAFKPSMWDGSGRFAHHGESVFFILDGARDCNYKSSGGFFPSQLRSEYHGVRATMEAYAQTAVIAGATEATACGIALQKGQSWDFRFRVTSNGSRVTYRLDRWD